MKNKIISLLLISALTFTLLLTGCTEDKKETQSTETQAVTQSVTQSVDYTDSQKVLNDYFNMYTEGDSPLYGTWKITGFEYLSFIFRNDGYAEMVMGTEGNFAELKINEKEQTLETSFFLGINGKYNYELSEDNKILILTNNGEETILTKQDDYNFLPKTPSKPAIDEKILGWWKGEHGLIYYFGSDGIMYSNMISTETCYSYNAKEGKITAVYDLGGEVTDEFEYTLKGEKLVIDDNDYSPFNPFEK